MNFQRISSTALINLSPKKCGTTFTYDLFAQNQKSTPGFFVTPIKEWYFFARDSRGYRNLSNTCLAEASHLRQHENDAAMRCEIQFCEQLAQYCNEHGERLIDKKMGRRKLLYTTRIAKRANNLLANFPAGSTILINDPNFLADFENQLNDTARSFLAWQMKPKNRLCFSVVRNPVDIAFSLVQMRRFTESQKLSYDNIKEAYDSQANYLKNLSSILRSRLSKNILLINFNILKNEPDELLKLVFRFANIPVKTLSQTEGVKTNRAKINFSSNEKKYVLATLNEIHNANPLQELYESILSHSSCKLYLDKDSLEIES